MKRPPKVQKPLPPYFRFLCLTFLLSGLLPACGWQNPQPNLPEVNEKISRQMADAVAKDLSDKNYQDLYNQLDLGFHTKVSNPKDLQKVVEDMFAFYGHPLEWVYLTNKTGIRKDGPWTRASRIFYYDLKTTKAAKGTYYLRIEIVTSYSGGFLDVSGFGFFKYKYKNGNTSE